MKVEFTNKIEVICKDLGRGWKFLIWTNHRVKNFDPNW